MLFSSAIHPAVKIGRLNLLSAVVSYAALSSAAYQKFDDFGIDIRIKLFYMRPACYECQQTPTSDPYAQASKMSAIQLSDFLHPTQKTSISQRISLQAFDPIHYNLSAFATFTP